MTRHGSAAGPPIGRRGLLVSGLLLALTFSVLACGREAGKREYSKEPIKVTLATSKNMWCTLSLVADAKGFYAKHGLDVSLQFLEAGRYCMDALVSNSAHFGNVVEVNVAYLGFSGNRNVSIVGSVAKCIGSAIVGRKSSGIGKETDLKGKRFALSPGTTSDVFAHRFLAKHGLRPAEVDLRKLQPLAMQGAMVAREVDAVSTWQPFVHNIMKALGDDAIEFRAADAYVGYENIGVRRDWAEQHPDAVLAFLGAMREAEAFVRANPEEAKAIVAKQINLDRAIVDATWSEYAMELSLGNDLLDNIKKEGEWIRATQPGFGDKPLPDYAAYLDRSFLDRLAAPR